MSGRVPDLREGAATDGFVVRDLDAFECAMIQFVLSWAPYGDPPEEECLPRFGKTVAALKAEIRELVRTPRCCSSSNRALLMRAARMIDSVDLGNAEHEGLRP